MTVHTFNFGTMLDELAARLEVDRPNSYFTDTKLKRWINHGMLEVAKRTKLVHCIKFLYISSGVQRYTCPSTWLYGQSRQILYLANGNLSGNQYPLKKLDRRGMQSVLGNLATDILSAGVAYSAPTTGYPTHYLLDGDVIEFHPIPNSNAAGSNRICLKFPGIPDEMTATSAVPGIALEYRVLPIDYAEAMARRMDKDPLSEMILARFRADCETANAEIKWADQEEPPSLLPEEYYTSDGWSIA